MSENIPGLSEVEKYITNKLKKQFLSPQERMMILKWMKNYGLTKDEMIQAFNKEYNSAPIRGGNVKVDFKFIEKIVLNLAEEKKKKVGKEELKVKNETQDETKNPDQSKMIEKKGYTPIEKKDRKGKIDFGEDEINEVWDSLSVKERNKLIEKSKEELYSSGIILKNINEKHALKIKVRAKLRKILQERKSNEKKNKEMKYNSSLSL